MSGGIPCAKVVGLLAVLSALSFGAGTGVQLRVPFFPDTTDQCGPSALAGVLSFWGKPTQPSELKKEMYVAKLRGTLPIDLVSTAEAHGLKTVMIRGNLKQLTHELEAGRPLLAMLNVGYAIMPVLHYVVVTGFDHQKSVLTMHSAGKADQRITYKKFLKQWEMADYWAMTATAS